MTALTSTDVFCYFVEDRNVVYSITKYGHRETRIKHPLSGEDRNVYTAKLYTTIELRRKSIEVRKERAARIGRKLR